MKFQKILDYVNSIRSAHGEEPISELMPGYTTADKCPIANSIRSKNVPWVAVSSKLIFMTDKDGTDSVIRDVPDFVGDFIDHFDAGEYLGLMWI